MMCDLAIQTTRSPSVAPKFAKNSASVKQSGLRLFAKSVIPLLQNSVD